MAELRRIGGLEALDERGCIVNPARLDRIDPRWMDAIRGLAEGAVEAWGRDVHSVYVRGSAPRGLAVDGFSDLDTLVAIRDLAPLPLPVSVSALEASIQERFGFIRGVEIGCFPRAETRAPAGSRAAILLKTQSVCVFGEDLIPEVPPVRMGRESRLEAPRLESSLEHAVSQLRRPGISENEVLAYGVWSLKILVRAGFELVQDWEAGYTRDLYACAESFARHYPAKAGEMWRAVELAVEPTADRAALVKFLSDFGRWVCRVAAAPSSGPPPVVC
jgi:hypothetical protein